MTQDTYIEQKMKNIIDPRHSIFERLCTANNGK